MTDPKISSEGSVSGEERETIRGGPRRINSKNQRRASGPLPVLDCSLCGAKIREHEPRWVATTDTVCMDCIRTLVDDELNRRIDGQPSSLTLLRMEAALELAVDPSRSTPEEVAPVAAVPPPKIVEALDTLVMGALHTGVLSRESENYRRVEQLFRELQEQGPEWRELATDLKGKLESTNATVREQREEIERLRSDRERLDALDNSCRQIAIRSFGGPEGTEKDFRWQVDTFGPSSHRPSVREAIDRELIAPLRSISGTPAPGEKK